MLNVQNKIGKKHDICREIKVNLQIKIELGATSCSVWAKKGSRTFLDALYIMYYVTEVGIYKIKILRKHAFDQEKTQVLRSFFPSL